MFEDVVWLLSGLDALILIGNGTRPLTPLGSDQIDERTFIEDLGRCLVPFVKDQNYVQP